MKKKIITAILSVGALLGVVGELWAPPTFYDPPAYSTATGKAEMGLVGNFHIRKGTSGADRGSDAVVLSSTGGVKASTGSFQQLMSTSGRFNTTDVDSGTFRNLSSTAGNFQNITVSSGLVGISSGGVFLGYANFINFVATSGFRISSFIPGGTVQIEAVPSAATTIVASTNGFMAGLTMSTGATSNVVTTTISYIDVMGTLLVNVSTMADITKVGVGGLDSPGGEGANIWYGVFIVYSSSGNYGIILSSSQTENPNFMPAGYQKWRRIGWVRNNGSSNFIPFFTRGNETLFTTIETPLSTSSPSASFADIDVSGFLPPTTRAASFTAYYNGNGTTMTAYLKAKGVGDEGNATQDGLIFSDSSNPNHVQIRTRITFASERALRYKAPNSTQFNVYCHGYEDGWN